MRASDGEIEALRAAVRDFLAGTFPEAAVRGAVEAGGDHDPRAWHTLSRELNLTGIGIPEALGGAGYSFRELGVVLEEFGATLAPVPLLSTAVAAAAVLATADAETAAALLPGLASGDVPATAVLTRPVGTAEDGDDGWVLDGTAAHVADGPAARLFVVRAVTSSGEVLLAVPADAPGVTVTRLEALDVLRPLAAVGFAGTPARLLARGPATGRWPALDVAIAAQLAAVAHEQVGGAARCLDDAVRYLTTRDQFGVLIGTFQALQHRCADVLTALDAARAVADDAGDRVAAALQAGAADAPADLHATAAGAAAWCAETYVRSAQENIQMHGGIGYTWEHDAHLHLRRAHADQLLYGTPREHRRVVADAMGIGPR
ncbi:acyl-CoA dehydrogenase family protein [Jatrophihabitans fulvus]